MPISDFDNFLIRMQPDFYDAVKAAASKDGVTASEWARDSFSAKLAESSADERLNGIVKAYWKMNDEGREHLATCARLTVADKGMRDKRCR